MKDLIRSRFNQFLPRAKSKLKLITTIGRGMMPVILENFDIPDCTLTDQYLKNIPLTLEPRSTEPQFIKRNSERTIHPPYKVPSIELKRIEQPVETAASFKGVVQQLLLKLYLPTFQAVHSQLTEVKPEKAREILWQFNLSTHNLLEFKKVIFDKFRLPEIDNVSVSLHAALSPTK